MKRYCTAGISADGSVPATGSPNFVPIQSVHSFHGIIATEEFSVRVILAMKDTRKLIPLFKIVSSLQESSEACPVFLLAKRILQKCTYPLGC